MRDFAEFWGVMIGVLDTPRRIRNWSAHDGLNLTGAFMAQSLRSYPVEQQKRFFGGYPPESPNDWIVCTQLRGAGDTKVSRKEFSDRYRTWPLYRDGRIIRKDFGGSPYLIALFNAFDFLSQDSLDSK